MEAHTKFIINQAIGYGWSSAAVFTGVVFICYFARNWPPQFSKIRFQLVLALAVIFITQGIREYLGTREWDERISRLPEEVLSDFQDLRLQLQVPKIIMAAAGLFVIRALSWELYGNKLTLIIAIGMLVASMFGVYLATR